MKKLALALPFLAGCVLVVDKHPGGPPPPPRYTASLSYRANWTDCRYVLWREYYDCDDYDVYYCNSLYGYDDDDLLVLLWISRYRRVPIRSVVYEYDHCGRNLWSVSVKFGLRGDEYFHPQVQPGYAPPPYGNAYGYYWKRESGYRLSNEEMRALVHLRIGVDYYGYKPHDYFKEHEKARQQGKPHAFKDVAVAEPQKAGSGGKNVHQVNVQKTERPWEAKDLHSWQKKRDEANDKGKAREEAEGHARHPEAERAKKQFEEEDRRRKEEAARRAREEADRRARDDAGRKAREEADRNRKEDDARKKAQDDARRKMEDDSRRKAADDARRKAEDDARRKQQEQQKKNEEPKKKEGGGEGGKGPDNKKKND